MNVYQLDGPNLSMEDLEFAAMNTLIEVVPNFREDTMHMIVGDFGPFRPSMPVTVPLWLAIMLKKGRKCRIRTPDWCVRTKPGVAFRWIPCPAPLCFCAAHALLACTLAADPGGRHVVTAKSFSFAAVVSAASATCSCLVALFVVVSNSSWLRGVLQLAG